MHGCYADSATDTDDFAVPLDMGRLSQWSEYIFDRISRFECGESMGRFSDGLEYEGDRPFLRIGICNGERDTLGIVTTLLHYDELSSFPFTSNVRSLDTDAEHFS